MTECWSQGELRAYLDRELPSEDQARAALHLAECDECGRVLAELETRARRVGALLDELAAAGPLPITERAPRGRRGRWVAAVLALAAGLVIVTLLWKRPAPAGAPAPPSPVPPATLASVEPAAPAAPAPRPVRRAVRPSRSASQSDGFVRLDDEPFETGLVVRMALGPNQVPADVVFSPDGRARAVRLVDFK